MFKEISNATTPSKMFIEIFITILANFLKTYKTSLLITTDAITMKKINDQRRKVHMSKCTKTFGT